MVILQDKNGNLLKDKEIIFFVLNDVVSWFLISNSGKGMMDSNGIVIVFLIGMLVGMYMIMVCLVNSNVSDVQLMILVVDKDRVDVVL